MQTSSENGRKRIAMKTPPIVSPQEWAAAREQLLVKEKELTRAREALAAERRRMPWPQRVRPGRRARVPHLLHRRPRRRSDGHRLELPRHDGARTSRRVGGLAGGLSPNPAVQVVELERELRP